MVLSQNLTAVFERMFAAYPKRPGGNPKAAARAAFERRVREGVDAEALVSAASRYAVWTRANIPDPLFIPHARTWLSRRDYEDYLADAPVSAGSAQQSPEHPLDHALAWMIPEIGPDLWRSWIAPIQVDLDAAPPVFVTHTQTALDRVRRTWGPQLAARYGEIAWSVASKERP